MTSKAITRTQEVGSVERFPDFPPRDDMQNWLFLYDSAILTALTIHFADLPNTTVASEVPVGPTLSNRENIRIPDLLVAFDSDRGLIEEQRGYAIDRQGKPPDFVLEVASPTTGVNDYTDKRRDYERYGIPEYWRFDPSGGSYYDAALAGDSLVGGEYQPLAVERLDESRWRGFSEALDLYLCWEQGRLRFYDPGTQSYLRTHEEEVEARREAEAEVRRLKERLEQLGETE